MIPDRREDRILYGRIVISVVLYVLFMIFSTSALLTHSTQDQPYLLGGLLIGSTLILPRAVPRGSSNDGPDDDSVAAEKAGVNRWLTWVRLAYLVVAAGLWFGLPELL